MEQLLQSPNTQLDWLRQVNETLTPQQLLWLSGYSYGLYIAKNDGNHNAKFEAKNGSHSPSIAAPTATLPAEFSAQTAAQTQIPLTILYGSHSGNGKKVAANAAEQAKNRGFVVKMHDMNEYPLKNLKQEKNLLVVVSTHGEGIPPIAAEDLYNHVHSPRAPKLGETSFSVLALGDKSYIHYCKTGADFDGQLEKLGATRIHPRVDCDVDFEQDVQAWIDGTFKALLDKAGVKPSSGILHTNGRTNGYANGHATPQPSTYTKQHPFEATVLEKVKLNGRGSVKETYHLELALEGSGLAYEPGDALGIYAENSEELVHEVLNATNLSADAPVQVGDSTMPLAEALTRQYELTILTRDTLTKHNAFAQSGVLQETLLDTSRLQSYLYGSDVVDVLTKFPVQHTPETLISILRKLPPRLYSIASSLHEHPDEAHLTVSAVRYEAGGRHKKGVASCFLADRVALEGRLKVFVERNEMFKLPQNSATDIIMIGPGTGIAPFRAFVEVRANNGTSTAAGKNWLFFGNPHFTTDFLYQTELQQWLKKGALARLDLAFSRDQADKLYVQHKLLARSKDVFAWLENGTQFYVCGDKNRMAVDVEAALRTIVERESGVSAERAAEYVKSLKKQRRYLEDVY